MSNAPSFVSERLSLIHERGLHRSPPILETSDGVRGRVDGREALLFCSNDYLGLRLDPRVREAAAEGADRYGGGTGSSRLIAGTLPIHRELEEALARWLGTPASQSDDCTQLSL